MYNPTKPYKKEILRLIKSTWQTPYVRVSPGLYPFIQRKFSNRTEIQHTDGIGTKGLFHWQKRTFKNAVLDALAMNLNDLVMVGAKAYTLQNHIVLPKDDHEAILKIVRALAHECRKRGIAMTGGETSIHDDAKGMDISITVSGFLEARLKNKCRRGDVLVGLPSSGLHSNGMTMARAVLGNRYRPEFTVPTKIYADRLLPLLGRYQIHGMMHITGGAFSKLKSILGNTDDAVIAQPKKLSPHKIFFDMHKHGASNKTMYTNFNCGVGFVLSADKKGTLALLRQIPSSAVLGEVIKGTGKIKISSAFDDRQVVL